jgi:hypothetical protein
MTRDELASLVKAIGDVMQVLKKPAWRTKPRSTASLA